MGACADLFFDQKNRPFEVHAERAEAIRIREAIAELAICEDARFYDLASGCLVSIVGGDAENVGLISGLTDTEKEIIRVLLERAAESKYSSHAGVSPTLDERGRVNQVLSRLVSHYAK